MAGEGGQGGGDSDGIFLAVMVFTIILIMVYGIVIFIPEIFITPLYYFTLVEAWFSNLFSFMNPYIAGEYNYIVDRDPSYFDISSIFAFAFKGHWFPFWMFLFAITGVFSFWASTKHGRYKVGKDVKLTPQWLIDNLDPWYPHLSPLRFIDPLKYKSKGGLLDFSEWPEEWALKNKIIPKCKCGRIMYEWPEIGGWSCEESMTHSEEGDCRYRQRETPKGFESSDQGFLDIDCINLLRDQLEMDSFGKWVDEDTLYKRNKLAYVVLAASYAAGSGCRDNAINLLGNLSYSIEENTSKKKGAKPFVMNKSIYKNTLKSAKEMMNKHTKGSSSDTAAYMFLKGIHAYDTTHIAHAFLKGGSFGVFNSGLLSASLKLFDRNLFYIISQVGRPTSFIEVTAIYEHMQHENALYQPLVEPMVDESYKAIKRQLGYTWRDGKHDDE